MKSCQLSARKVSTAKQQGYYLDGGGLYLQVSQSGTKSWVFRFKMNGRVRDAGLGSVGTFSLKEARERARKFRQLVADGIDPIEDRRNKKDAARTEQFSRLSFKDAAQRFLELHQNEWKNQKHREQWLSSVKTYAYPSIGNRPVATIDGAIVTEALSPIWTKKPVTARRVRQRIERVVKWVRDGMPLPTQGASKRVKHYPALPFVEIASFIAALRERKSISARALEFTILTAARTSEAIGAKWSEIDLDAAVWTIPARRMKGDRQHQVPLSQSVLGLLETLPREAGGYVFPGAKAKSPLSNMAMLELLRGMNGNGLTVHGFRSSFRDWAGDRTHYPREVIEHALAHQIKDKAEAAYRRSDALEKRRRLMEEWAKYCSSPVTASEVVALHG